MTRTIVVEAADTAGAVATLLRSQLQPSALDVLHPGRVAVLFEGSARAVAAQLEAARALVGAAEDDGAVWEESRARQGEALGRIRFAPGELANVLSTLGEAIVRPSAGVAYVPHRTSDVLPPATRRLTARIKDALDPGGTLA